ncbi:MAG: class I SAM-dependent methyltransferase [Elusimicrobia bacterium]|nr:class I SAM-dependent methyltransferase [Elusimicrobiota bacterium]
MPADKGRFYESIAADFDGLMDRHELAKRLRVVFGRPGPAVPSGAGRPPLAEGGGAPGRAGQGPLLTRADVQGQMTLDAGSGTGHFSRALSEMGARLVSLDLGPALLAVVRGKCRTLAAQGSLLDLPFQDGTFRAILCTEVIEHTADPRRAVGELCRVLAPGGVLALTVPNKRLRFALTVAEFLRLRPYAGLENWVGYGELAGWLEAAGVVVESQFGFNLLPAPFFCRPAFDGLDRAAPLHPVMVNVAVRCRKPAP